MKKTWGFYVVVMYVCCSGGIAAETGRANPTTNARASVKELFLVSEAAPLKARWIPGQDKVLVLTKGVLEMVDPGSGTREKLFTMDMPLDLDQQPFTVSPDGTRVVLKETDRTYVYNLRNQEKTKIVGPRTENMDMGGGMVMTTTLFSFGFEWSSDVRNIAYYYSGREAWLFGTEEARARLFLPKVEMDSLLFSPADPMTLSYLEGETLYMMNLKDKRAQELAKNVEAYAWFPSADRIAFVQKDVLVVLQLKKGKETRYSLEQAPRLSKANRLAVSPDGQKIVYVSDKTGGGDLFVYDLLTKTATNLTLTEDWSESAPQWSSDGNKLLFLRSADPKNAESVVPVILTF